MVNDDENIDEEKIDEIKTDDENIYEIHTSKEETDEELVNHIINEDDINI